MYGEIASTLVNQFLDKIQEGKIYEIRRFLVRPMKGWYKPVEGDNMIRFGRYTSVQELDENVMDYPLCTYSLTPIDELPSPTDNPLSFTGALDNFSFPSFSGYFHLLLWPMNLVTYLFFAFRFICL
jgi:replication factor A1